MEKSLFIEFIDKYFAKVIGKIVEKYNDKSQESALLHKTMLTNEYSADLNWGSTTLNHSVVAADIVSLDSSLPLKSRPTISLASGTLPKVGVKYKKGEKEITDLNIMMSRGTNESTLASKILDDAAKVIKAVDVRNEIMFEQGLSTGTILVNSDNNDGTGVRVNFGYKEENTFKAIAAAWATTTTATPIDDIQQMFDKATEDGNAIGVVMLSKKYFDYLRASLQGKQLVANYDGIIYTNNNQLKKPGQSKMLEALRDEFGADFRVVDTAFKVENHDGTTKSIRPWEEANVVAIPEENVGRLVYGTLAEETNPVASVSYQKAGNYTLVSKYSKTDPLEEYTCGQALCLPVIDGADAIYMLKADQKK